MLRLTTQDLSRQTQPSDFSVYEDSHYFRVSLNFSQFDESSLDLWVADHQLTLMADERPQPFGRHQEPLFKCINLPIDADEDSIQAELKNARLEIRFKKDRANPRSEF